MTPLERICTAIRQPDESRAPAIATLAELWAGGELTDAETRASIPALTDAALNYADSAAMGVLGQMHLAGVNGIPDYDAALAWLRKAAAYGNQYAIRHAAGCALMIAEEREPEFCGPLTLEAVGWTALALHYETEPPMLASIMRGLADMQAEYGLSAAQVNDAMADAMNELSKEH